MSFAIYRTLRVPPSDSQHALRLRSTHVSKRRLALLVGSAAPKTTVCSIPARRPCFLPLTRTLAPPNPIQLSSGPAKTRARCCEPCPLHGNYTIQKCGAPLAPPPPLSISSPLAAALGRWPYHEGVGSLVLELRPLPQVVEDARFVDVVQRGHVSAHLGVVGVRFPEPLSSLCSCSRAEQRVASRVRDVHLTIVVHPPCFCANPHLTRGKYRRSPERTERSTQAGTRAPHSHGKSCTTAVRALFTSTSKRFATHVHTSHHVVSCSGLQGFV